MGPNRIIVILISLIIGIGLYLSIHIDTATAQQQYPNNINNNNGVPPQQQPQQQIQKQSTLGITISVPAGAGLKILDNYYQPMVITVPVGSKIIWKNDDVSPHTATSLSNGSNPSGNGKIFDTGIIPPGSSKSVTVNKVGTINYFCSIHPWMQGTLNVVQTSNAEFTGNQSQTQKSSTQLQQQRQQELPLQQPLDKMLSENKPIVIYFKAKNMSFNNLNNSVIPNNSNIKNNSITTETATTTSTIAAATNTGTESKNKDNWITASHDIFGTRSSNQTAIDKQNVGSLQVKWILNTQNMIEDSPLIIGDMGFAQDNDGNIFAFNATTGENLWKVATGNGGLIHGLTFDNGVVYAGTGKNATVLALNATNGKKIWQSQILGPNQIGYSVSTPPIVWKNFVVVGSAGGDYPPYPGVIQGNITALDKNNGNILWNLRTTTGDWVTSKNVPPNGGATAWTGGSFDPETGLLYVPLGNPTPDFNPSTRQNSTNYFANSVIAVNITNGNPVWVTPFFGKDSIFKINSPETHDDDVSWGVVITKATFDNGTQKKMVIGHDKFGSIIAMDANTGKPIWWNRVGFYANKSIDLPLPGDFPKGSGLIWGDTHSGIQAYAAADKDTLYVATSNVPENWFKTGNAGYLEPQFNAIKNGIGNGTITAIDIKTGKTKWIHPTEFPTWVSPAVSNGVVFTGQITNIGTPYKFDVFGTPAKTPLLPNGIVMALDKDTGKTLWQFRVGAPIGVGGPSLGNNMLYVPTGSHEIPALKAGAIVAFGLPAGTVVVNGGNTTK